MHGFVEGLSFCRHFLGMNVSAGEELVTQKKSLRILGVSDAHRTEKTQDWRHAFQMSRLAWWIELLVDACCLPL